MAEYIVKDGKVFVKSNFYSKDMDGDYYKKVPDPKSTSVFYYDRMLSTPSLTVRLVNPKYTKESVPVGEMDSIADALGKVKSNSPAETILTGVYKDDFYMSSQTTWQSGGGGMMKMLVDSAASMITSRDFKFFNSLAGSALANFETNEKNSGVVGLMKDIQSNLESYSNAHIFTAEDYFKTFKGTNITLPMNITVSLLTDNYDDGTGNFKDIKKILNGLYDVSIGDMESHFNYVGIQHAPNNFASTFGNLDASALPGTFHVIFGDPNMGGIIIKNMLISNVTATISKTIVDISPPPKLGSSSKIKSEAEVTEIEVKSSNFRPLFIDVQVTLEPARMFLKGDLKEILGISK